MQLEGTKPSVTLGERVYSALSWKRKDRIYLGKTLIGVILLSETDRRGVTVSLTSGARKPGRAVEWCFEQSKLQRHAPAPRRDMNPAIEAQVQMRRFAFNDSRTVAMH